MSDLGTGFAWLAVQVALFLVPALVLVALASRRGPAGAAWISTLSLGLVAVLAVSSLLGFAGRGISPVETAVATAEPTRTAVASPPVDVGRRPGPEALPPPVDGLSVSRFQKLWERLGRGAAEPAARVRPWGTLLAFLALVGTTLSLARLATGVLAVWVCRRRGRLVDDSNMIELVDALRGEMGCPKLVDLREADDLTSPATAGWLRPVVLLPPDWRTWNLDERRAVLAHELAHVVRGDYAAGLAARLAVAINAFHPLVWWTAGRLDVLQEQAADALAARFAGGRSSYLIVLARLALKQDGRSPRWPARAFLPDRGALIRRIAMLQAQDEARPLDRSNSRAWRLPATIALVGLAVGVAALRGPARADDGSDSPAKTTEPASTPPAVHEPIPPVYVPDGSAGFFAFRPASVFRQTSLSQAARLMLADSMGVDVLPLIASALLKPGALEVDFEDVEWATCGIRFPSLKDKTHGDLNQILLGGLTVRTFAPFDWPGFLRQFPLELVEVRESGRVYYQIKGPIQPLLGPHPCIYPLDDRTIVMDEEKAIRAFIGRPTPFVPDFLRGPDWEQASRGILAVVVDNRNSAFEKRYAKGGPQGDEFLPFLKGVDRWVFHAEDAQNIALRLALRHEGREANEKGAGAFRLYLKQALDESKKDRPHSTAAATPYDQRAHRMAKTLLGNARVEPTDHGVEFRSSDFGTLADLDMISKGFIEEVNQSIARRQAALTDKADSTRR